MSTVQDAWDDEWSQAADTPGPSQSSSEQSKKVSSKVTKAQKRAQQAEFNRQLWAEAEGPKQTNYFLESRNVVPLRQEYKAPPILLSRKGPIIQSASRPPPPPTTEGLKALKIRDESSEDEDEAKAQAQSLADRQAQAAREREEKQRKYEERRLELFGPQNTQGTTATRPSIPTSQSGNSSPRSGTPPHSRSATPNRGGAGRRGRGRGAHHVGNHNQSRSQQQGKELFDATYAPKPDSLYSIQRRAEQQGSSTMVFSRQDETIYPVRAPRGPDGTAGFNYANHDNVNRTQSTEDSTPTPPVKSTT